MIEDNHKIISVLLSVHNGEEYLAEAIESILSQSFSRFEFIIIDDGSTDGTPRILEEYRKGDKRIVLLRNDAKIGLAESLNRGLSVATGSFIARMDADDVSLPRRLESQYAFLRENPEIDLIGSDALVIDDLGRELGVNVSYRDPELLRRIIRFRTVAFHPAWFLRRTAIDGVEGYRDFPVSQDFDLLLRLVEKGFRISNYPGVLIKQRRYSGISNRNAIAVRKVTDYILALRKERIPEGRDSYSREKAYRCAENGTVVAFMHARSQDFLGRASRYKRCRKKIRASFYYFLSALSSFYQLRMFLRIFRSWLIIRSWRKS